MSREIRFRVWANKDKIWMNHCAVIDCQGKVGSHFVEVIDNENIIEHLLPIDYLEPIIQEFTGLKDIKGNDIFEGDILKFHWKAIELGESEEWTGEVFWDSERAGFFISRHGQWTIKEIRNPEVIGNVFENPDLLR